VTTGTCIDCGVTILGERPRCPACHDRHAEELVAEDVTTPRDRTSPESWIRILFNWLVAAQIAGAIVLTIWIVLARGCR